MAEPWFTSNKIGDMWHVNGDEPTMFVTEKAARRYAALPVLIATIRNGLNKPHCAFCGFTYPSEYMHDPNCEGIAALKAAVEDVANG